MATIAALRRTAEAGIDQTGINENRRLLYQVAMTDAHAALDETETAVAAVEGAATLAEAQDAVDGLADTVGGAKGGIEGVRPDLA